MQEFLDRSRDVLSELGWVDTVSLAFLFVFLIRGFLHGLVWQVAALLGVVGGLLAARSLAPDIAPTVRDWFPSLEEKGALDMVVAYFSVFILVLLGAALLGKLLRGLIDQLKLASYDRLLGGIFGVVKAAAILVLGVSLLSLFEPAGDVLAASRTARYSGAAIERGDPFFPAEVKEHLEEAFQSLGEVLEQQEAEPREAVPPASPPETDGDPSDLQEQLDRLLDEDPEAARRADGGG